MAHCEPLLLRLGAVISGHGADDDAALWLRAVHGALDGDERSLQESDGGVRCVTSPECVLAVAELMATMEVGVVNRLFGSNARRRWVSAYFPFTLPSFELEVEFQGKWLEVAGCGVIHKGVYERSKGDWSDAAHTGWAFGLGLERLAMVVFGIPDIRLFWSEDPRFLKQFMDVQVKMEACDLFSAEMVVRDAKCRADAVDQVARPQSVVPCAVLRDGSHVASDATCQGALQDIVPAFRPYSAHPPCVKDVSMWMSSDVVEVVSAGDVAQIATVADREAGRVLYENDLMETMRSVAGVLIEEVTCVDQFIDPKTGRESRCYRIVYRHADRNLTNEEVNALHFEVRHALAAEHAVELR